MIKHLAVLDSIELIQPNIADLNEWLRSEGKYPSNGSYHRLSLYEFRLNRLESNDAELEELYTASGIRFMAWLCTQCTDDEVIVLYWW
jgi:hypothetical protein